MKLSTLIIALFITYSGFAQTADAFAEIDITEVPKEVITSFNEMEPKAAVDSWRVERRKYEVKFKNNNRWVYHRFNDEGLFLETRVLKSWDKEASTGLKEGKKRTSYKYYDVIEFYEVETFDEDLYYVVQLEDRDTKDLQTLYMKDDGSLRNISKSGY